MMEDEFETSYYRFDSPAEEGLSFNEDACLMHVPERSKAHWHHVQDLDGFFTRVYHYHQKHGLLCIFLQQCFELVQFFFVISFVTVLFSCVDYDALFANKLPAHYNRSLPYKMTIPDVLYPSQVCYSRIASHSVLVFFIIIAACFWVYRVCKLIASFFQLLEIRRFYHQALRIRQTELEYVSWHEVQQRIMIVQEEQQMCIHKQRLTELDIYNRTLRFKNYLVAMVNKGLLPPQFNIPFLGNIIFLTQSLIYNIEFIFFWGPRAVFSSGYHMKPEYKQKSRRNELAKKLSSDLMWLGLLNLFLSPIIFLWQILYTVLTYTETIKNEPGFFGSRKWSIYSYLYLRHFNELSHEFHTRLKQGYKPAASYMDTFSSPIMAVIGNFILFVAGAILAVIILLAVWDEDVLKVEHVLTVIGILTVVVRVCRSLIPDESVAPNPEKLMKSVISQVHYAPDTWYGQAHTYRVRDEFAQLFPYKATVILEELLSPIVTPFILIFWMRSRSGEFIDFFHNFTVDIAGVGDVCSFAQMDIKRHGDPRWHDTNSNQHSPSQQADDGKTELSLMHFTITNPKWNVPEVGRDYLKNVFEKAQNNKEIVHKLQMENIPQLSSVSMQASLNVSLTMDRLSSTLNAAAVDANVGDASDKQENRWKASQFSGKKTGKHGASSVGFHHVAPTSAVRENALNEMNLSALFMHELHHQRLHEENAIMWETLADESAEQLVSTNQLPVFRKGYDSTAVAFGQHFADTHDCDNTMRTGHSFIHRPLSTNNALVSPVVGREQGDQHTSSDSDVAPQEFHIVDQTNRV